MPSWAKAATSRGLNGPRRIWSQTFSGAESAVGC